MSTNVYGPQNGPAPDFLRNVYDKQFQNLITTNFGDLRVCFCKEVLPGDSVNIDPVVAIRSQPIVFPIQTRMKFYCHFFYGRNRILMKNWEDFIFKTKDNIVPPLLKLNNTRAKAMISTGSLGDNLGVPSTFIPTSQAFENVSVTYVTGFAIHGSSSSYKFTTPRKTSLPTRLADMVRGGEKFDSVTSTYLRDSIGFSLMTSDLERIFANEDFNSLAYLSTAVLTSPSDDLYVIIAYNDGTYTYPFTSNIYKFEVDSTSDNGSFVNSYHIDNFESFVSDCQSCLDSHSSYRLLFTSLKDEHVGTAPDDYYGLVANGSYYPTVGSSSYLIPSKLSFGVYLSDIVDSTDDSFIDSSPFVGNNPTIPLSALPFRLYEFICNYYYRNDTNNPYVLDNEPQYNKFIPTDDDGWDENLYVLHKRNWESDMFTTCVPSPQFGTAPLVGLTYNGGLTAEVTTNVTDSDGVTQSLGIQVAVDDEGNITDIINADTGVPSGSLKSLMDAMSTTGISINTLRNVNSFQRFLENVIRRGLRYRNQLLSHFGVSVDYPDIDIPQFIGGFSGDLVVREVTNMAESSEVALGDVAGKIDAVIQSNHSINCYCAEHGFIMGIFCIVPVPTYSQVLPHMFTRYDAFDYFQKEFDKIGYVPVTYRNFLPLQSDNPDEVFGYQRAWYEYMSSIDEVHGDFRMSLDDFVLYRVFSEKPTLNESFLTVDSDSLNNIFAVDKVEEKYKNADKFMCQFYFQYSQKTMIPKHGVASLE